MRRKNILITGGAGFIGYHIAKKLLQEGYFVRVFDNLYRGDIDKFHSLKIENKVQFIEGDIRYLPRLLDACEGIDYIFHEAADCINKSLQNPSESFDINVVGTSNLFEAAKIKQIKKIIFASSASVYGDPDKLPMDENSPIKPITPYCIGKYATEKIAEYYSRFHNIDYIGFRYFNVYGPRQNVDAYYTNVVILFLKRIMNGEPPIINGDGKQSMDFIHVDDIANANILAIESNIKNEIFNLGTNKSTTIAELAAILIRAFDDTKVQPKFNATKSFVKERRADFRKAKKLLGWQPKINVEDGMLELAKDIINNPELY